MVTIVPKNYLAVTPDIILDEKDKPRIPVVAFGMSLGIFLAITFILCVGFDLLFPNLAMHIAWQQLLPAFTWLSWPSFFWAWLRASRTAGTSR